MGHSNLEFENFEIIKRKETTRIFNTLNIILNQKVFIDSINYSDSRDKSLAFNRQKKSIIALESSSVNSSKEKHEKELLVTLIYQICLFIDLT
ncbi:hypothetical protein BpHYR1_050807 [Brachionus plicatilis]|uniref:Uncharacterized protein n=1 Tax=Brachionus plicatilis TaxID=10195 RepID=A0A3M7T848_BRAPC|nr:hypothetical protein BpHYR1_050807 [Brachionus plicatilis]